MANMHQILLTILIIQIHANAAPSEKLEKSIEAEQNDTKLNSSNVEDNSDKAVQGQRRRRQFFNYYDYSIPSFNPFYQALNLEQSAQTGGYGFEDPYAYIHRRLQEILEGFRRPIYNVPPSQPIAPIPPVSPHGLFQFLIPVAFIPQPDCRCYPDYQIPPDPLPNFDFPTYTENPRENETPMDNQPPRVDEMTTSSPIPDNSNSTSNQIPITDTPSQPDRPPSNETSPDNQTSPPEEPDTSDDDFTRPISFDPVPPPMRTTLRPPPSVNHGIMQAGLPQTDSPNVTDSEEDFTRPISFEAVPPPGRNVNRSPPPVDHGIMQAGSAQSVVTTTAPILESAVPLSANVEYQPSTSAPETLTACDKAILNCCHQPVVKLSCFALENCPQLIINNPCSANVVLSAIDRYQQFYGEKSW